MPRRFWLFAPLDEPEDETLRRALGLADARGEEARARVARRSLDARKGHPLGFHLEVEVYAAGEKTARAEVAALPPPTRAPREGRVVVVGSGPAGTFAALRLS